MAHFLASIQGSRGEASRLGTKNSGLDVTAASWAGSVSVRLWYSASDDLDMCNISLAPWHGSGVHVPLYHGPVGSFVFSDLSAIVQSEVLKNADKI